MTGIVFSWLERNTGKAIAAVLLVTALLLPPMVFLAPESEASTDPPGEVFDTQALIDERLVSPIFETFWIAEARDGDMLTRDPLLELLNNSQELREHPGLGPLLISYESATLQDTFHGIYSIADGVDRWLRENGASSGLEGATDDDVKSAVSHLMEEGAPTAELGDSFAVSTTVERREVAGQEIDYWVTPALGFRVQADNEALGGGSFTIGFGGDDTVIRKEEFNREVQDVIRGDEGALQIWGTGLDLNLTSQDQGATAAPFIGLAIVAVLIVAGAITRSYWAVVLMGSALAILIVWLRGLTNLAGLDSSLLVDFIVPIAMVSFGVDFAFHAIGRYRESIAAGHVRHRQAFVAGLTAVSGALLLALASDTLAFLANITANIPAVIQFGISAAIALCAAYLLLGILVPLALMRAEERLEPPPLGNPRRTTWQWIGTFLAALFAGLSVLTLILLPLAGIAALAVYLLAFAAVPYWLGRRHPGQTTPGSTPAAHGASMQWMGRVVVGLASARMLLLPVVLVVTLGMLLAARNVDVAFDAKDFLDTRTDFVVGLDKLDEHISSGERAVVYIETDLAHPGALTAIDAFVTEISTTDSGRYGYYRNGETQVDAGALEIVQAAMTSRLAIEEIAGHTGLELTANGANVAETPEANLAIFDYAAEHGIPGEAGLLVTPDNVPARAWRNADGAPGATQVSVGLIGSREQANVSAAREELGGMIGRLQERLDEVPGESVVTLTGSPIERDEGLQATVDALLLSLPVAVALCFVVAALFMRSLRFAVVTIVPVLLVVSWLYGFMALAGFPLNIATATIGAISVGIGIDYAVHFSMRYREELARNGYRTTALRIAGSGTGAALFASAASSAIGFSIMAFAPMPLFATYGLLTAIMIGASAAASLLVLPSLLMLITRDSAKPGAAPSLATSGGDMGTSPGASSGSD